MDKRSQLVLDRARKLFDSAYPGESWLEPSDRPNKQDLERQARCLARAEDQMLKQGLIENVDQS